MKRSSSGLFASAFIAIEASVALALLAGCSRDAPSSAASASASASALDAAPPPGPSLGDVMAQVGRRFELTGRAVVANRFELAEFEAGEIEELFAEEVPRAELPKEGPTAHIQGMAKAFLDSNAPDLKKAAALHDPRSFATAFARTATACNACHAASAKAFIQVPLLPGKPVPDLDPVPLEASPVKAKP